MKTIKTLSAKKIISFCIAMALIFGSLFTANVGANLKVSASTGVSEYTTEENELSLLDPAQPNSQSNPYIIANANQMYCLMIGNSTNGGVKIDTAGKFFKVADGIKAFYMNGGATVAAMTTPAQVKEYFTVTNTSAKKVWSAAAKAFKGTFDGNGVTIYGIRSDDTNAGLFPFVDGDATIKNVTVKNSYLVGVTGGGLVASVNGSAAPNSITAENCQVINNYISGSRGDCGAGGLFGFLYSSKATSGYPEIHVNNCLVAGNELVAVNASAPGAFSFAGSFAGDRQHKISNSIFLGGDGIFNTASWWARQPKFYENVYTDADLSGVAESYTAGTIATIKVDDIKGLAAKVNMPLLNWATDDANGYGYWHVSESGYPTSIKPDGWVDIQLPHVWDGSAATAFESGSGTKDDPYIIKTPEQLRKMVLEGGRKDTGKTKEFNNNGTIVNVKVYEKAYYKVADGVTDIYLNSVAYGSLETIKSLANAGIARNWTEGLFTNAGFMADSDGDGLYDQATGFRGEFDGNGATIHGLYSKTVDRGWNNEGVGFVPALLDNAVIKNVTFDKAYVHNTGYTFAAVITTSLGYDANMTVTNPDMPNDPNATNKVNGILTATTSVGIHNVAIKNSRVQTNASSGFAGIAGFVTSHGVPEKLSFTNCLFDDSNELVTPSGASYSNNSTGKAGFVALSQTGTIHFSLENCVSLGVYPDNKVHDKVEYTNCYTSEASSQAGLTGGITEYNMETMPALNWTQWSVVNGKLAVTGNSGAYDHALNWTEAIANCNENRWSLNYPASTVGNWTMLGGYTDGTYINYENMLGSGTEADPYLISDALTLARVIGSGGVNHTEKLYFKLTNDIDVGGLRWITTDTYTADSTDKYLYVPFSGVLDGDGYAVTNLYANSQSAALIPVLDGGTVKNLHVRNAYVVSETSAGAIVGEAYDTADDGVLPKIVNCSVEGATVSAEGGYYDELYFVGYDDIGDTENFIINNCYFTGTNGTVYITDDYYSPITADELKDQIVAGDADEWYIGVGDDKMPKLINRANTMPCADVDGDGNGYEYTLTDAVALKNRLLKKKAYANVYGDVNKDGSTNSTDLVALRRAIAEDYNHIKDGFWRNVQLGNMAIYYGENDNYDAARKLELALESAVPGVDVIKNASGTNTFVHENDGNALPGTQLAIVVGNVGTYQTALTGNNYGITYDKENAVLWIQGANFTGVEQAVLDFINNSNAKDGTVYTVATATLSAEKQPKTIGGTTYYYAWGDEFDVATSDNSVQKEVWAYSEMGTETDNGATSKYMNTETADIADLANLYDVKDGKLTIWRGINKNNYVASTHAWGYKPVDFSNATTVWGDIESDDLYASAGKISTEKSMLFKQGYVEMKASLPNDGHSFPAWWLYGSPNGGQNRTYSSSLFGKVYKENPNWTGINTMNGAYPNTYQYQIPTAHLEFDIVELMQDISYAEENNSFWDNLLGTGIQKEKHLTGIDRTAFNLTIHKWYSENVKNDILYVIDWDAWLTNRTAPAQYKTTTNGGTFNTSVSYSFITRWGGSHEYDFGNLADLAGEHVYGFKWVADESDNTFTVTMYVDGVQRMTFNQSQAYYNSAESKGGTYAKDGETFNQYVYFILDNHFYSANQYYKDGTKEYTDLLTQESGDKATFDIEYVRVYQEDGKRDIVTKETENFNNNNHFGYGK